MGSATSSGHTNVTSSVRLNELMSANQGAYQDDMGQYSDWIELANMGSEEVNIGGWKLSDGKNLFTFPDETLMPGQFLLIFASGKERALPGQAHHANFKLSASGETVTLVNEREELIDEVDLPALSKNASYARDAQGAWRETAAFTPGQDNNQPYTAQQYVAQASGSGLMLNEVMADSVNYALDEQGVPCDYIELYNGTGRALSLAGYGLSDDSLSPGKYTLPNITLEDGAYLLLRASGRNAEGHVPFSLSEGESVLLTDAHGQALDSMTISTALPDKSWSRDSQGEWTDRLPPTPSYSNDAVGAAQIDALLTQQNSDGLYLNEVMASTNEINANTRSSSYDWVELYNASNQSIDLSGWGLSDNPNHPRKWQFPQGAQIAGGAYLVVYLSGQDGFMDGSYHASFSLSRTEGESLSLCRPNGSLVDRVVAPAHYANISLGRVSGQNGFYFFDEPTPGQPNRTASYQGRAQTVTFSVENCVQQAPFSLTLTAGPDETIFYTTDCTEPTVNSTVYSGPIPISQNTVVRAIAWKSSYLPSIASTHTYLMNVSHTLPIVCLTSDPDGMFGAQNGMYTHETELWTRAAYIEYYSTEGRTILSQGVDISLHGNDARKCKQKTFNVIARSVYGDNRLRAPLFPNRDYTEYQSILLRPSSEDSTYTRMRDSILSTLCADTTVMYQDTAVAVLYINGEYWGHYNLRERTNSYAIAQWENWQDPDQISIIKGNSLKVGSDQTFKDLMSWIKENGVLTRENLAYVNTIVDVENYLDYVMVEMFVANSDLLNVKFYRSSTEGDGRWRWIIFDLDWAFHNDSNSYTRWLNPGGVGIDNATDNRLFVALMKNDEVKDYFLRTLGERMATCWRSEVIISRIDERKALLEPEMPANFERWGESVSRWREKVEDMRQYAITRPSKLIGYIAEEENLSEADIQKYFGAALANNPVN